jgi:uncharacterized repeat protein (TIGR01451 family)
MKFRIAILTALVTLALPQVAQAACPVGIANELSVVPPQTLAEGQTQQHTYRVTACTQVQKVTVEWIRVKQSNRPWLYDATNRETIVPETSQGTNMTGQTSFTVPAGLPDGHYAVITRYYAQGYTAPEDQAGSSFSIMTPDVCANIAGKQQTVPAGLVSDGSGNCVEDVCANIGGIQQTVPAGLVPDGAGNCVEDKCPNVDGIQIDVPAGYTLVAGECRIIATPTGEDPKPLAPNPWITKRANRSIVSTGGLVTYTISAGNRGPGILRNARLCDRLPAGTIYQSHTGNGAFANGSLCWNLGNMRAGAKATVKLTVKVSPSFTGKRLVNTACITATNAAKKCAKAVVKVKVKRREPVGGVTG